MVAQQTTAAGDDSMRCDDTMADMVGEAEHTAGAGTSEPAINTITV